MKLGEFVRERRLEQNIGLRQFCLATGVGPEIWSKVERHETYLKNPEAYLPNIAEFLKLDLDALKVLHNETQVIPLSFYSLTEQEKLIRVLPAFFPKTGNQEQDDHNLREYVKQAYENAYGEPLPDGLLKIPNVTTLQAMKDAENRVGLTTLNSIDELFESHDDDDDEEDRR